MLVKEHIIIGALAAAVVSYYASPKAGISLLAGSALIDADHYLWYAIYFKDRSLRRATRFFESKEADKYYCLCVLHTIEAMALYAACILLTHGVIFWVSVGCMTHMALDAVQSIRDRGLFLRRWSLIHAVLFRMKSK